MEITPDTGIRDSGAEEAESVEPGTPERGRPERVMGAAAQVGPVAAAMTREEVIDFAQGPMQAMGE